MQPLERSAREAAARPKGMERSSTRIGLVSSIVASWANERIAHLSPQVGLPEVLVSPAAAMLRKPALQHARALAVGLVQRTEAALDTLLPRADLVYSCRDGEEEDAADRKRGRSWTGWSVPRPVPLYTLRSVTVRLSRSASLRLVFVGVQELIGSMGARDLRAFLARAHPDQVMQVQHGSASSMVAKALCFIRMACERLLGGELAVRIFGRRAGDWLSEAEPAGHDLDLAADIRHPLEACDVSPTPLGPSSVAAHQPSEFHLVVKNSFIDLIDEEAASPRGGAFRRSRSWSHPSPVGQEPEQFTLVVRCLPGPTSVGDAAMEATVAAASGRRSQAEIVAPAAAGPAALESSTAAPALVDEREEEEVSQTPQVAVMIRNLPSQLTRSELIQLLEDEGFFGRFVFVYLPVDFTNQVGLGYATVVMGTAADAQRLKEFFDGHRCRQHQPDAPACEAVWNDNMQTLDGFIERYRNSPVMHPIVPEEHKPALFENGRMVSFPESTKPIRRPRIRHLKDPTGAAQLTADAHPR